MQLFSVMEDTSPMASSATAPPRDLRASAADDDSKELMEEPAQEKKKTALLLGLGMILAIAVISCFLNKDRIGERYLSVAVVRGSAVALSRSSLVC